MDEYFKANQKMWDEITPVHYHSNFYDVDGFKKGKCTLLDVEVEEVGDVTGKSLLHLQCHFGQDTLCWARRGANVTGVDFSEKGVEQAISLSKELDIPAKFICCDIYDLDKKLNEKFDVIFTSAGVLIWLEDLKRWAEIIAHFLKPNGVFYIREFHPVEMLFDDESETPKIKYPYFKSDKPLKFEPAPDYADPDYTVESIDYEWTYSMGDIINSLIGAGLDIEYLHEFNYSQFKSHPFLTQGKNRMWRYEGIKGGLPLMFSIKARKK
jgi:SAM-dependent methyltransferase